jgi:hypothetical protein
MAKKNKNKTIIFSLLIALAIVIAILFLIIFIPCESPPVKINNSDNGSASDGKTYCKPEQRGAEFCYEIYAPVCGWFNQNIKCIKYPCAQNFENDCFACANENVEYYTQGECPQ